MLLIVLLWVVLRCVWIRVWLALVDFWLLGLVLFVWLTLLCCVMRRYCDLCCFGVACLRCGFEFRFA